tara:strand:+ start:2310 stop:2945 length:636 start_codon:yes stop_codon:yes gene_type:complete
MKITRPLWESHGHAGSLQGQDAFVSLLLPCRHFIDVGAGHGIFKNNTWNLERAGWRGLLFDRNPRAIENCRLHRQSQALCIDARTFDFAACFEEHKLPKILDYVSFDVDAATIEAVANFPFEEYEFLVMTIEHDLWSRGPEARDAVRARMSKFPHYQLAAPDVCWAKDKPVEDWFINTRYFPSASLNAMNAEYPWWAVIQQLAGEKPGEPA